MGTLGSLLMQMDLDGTSFVRNAQNVKSALASIESSAAKTGSIVDGALQGSSGTLVQVYEHARRGSGAITKSSDELGTSLTKAAGAVRGLALPIISELSPALGSTGGRMMQLVATSAMLGGGLGGVALAAAGVAGIIGGSLLEAFRKTSEEKQRLDRVLRSGSIAAIAAEADKTLTKIDELNEKLGKLRERTPARGFLGRTLQRDEERGSEGERGKLVKELERARHIQQLTAGAAMLEDPAGGGARAAEDSARAFFELEKTVKAFGNTTAELFAENPLQKMLMAIGKEAETLRETLRSLGVAADLKGPLSDLIDKAAGAKSQKTSDAFFKSQGAGAADRLGLGGSNLLAGFQEIEQLKGHRDTFEGRMRQLGELAKSGLVPVTDLFAENARASEAFEGKLTELEQRFASQPAVVEKLRATFANDVFGGFGRNLDAIVRSAAGARQGFAELIDTTEGIQTRWVPSLQNAVQANYDLTDAANQLGPSVSALHDPIVTVTGDVWALYEALRFATYQATQLDGAIKLRSDAGGIR